MSERPRILGPDGREVTRDEPLLVDAQGRAIRGEDTFELPERPRLRPLEFAAVREQDRDLLIATDPLGVCENVVALRIEVLPLLQMLDGRNTVDAISQQVVAASGDLKQGDAIKQLLEELDRLFLLESPRYEARRREVAERYREETVREAALAGSSYPAEPEELRKFLAGHYAEAEAIAGTSGAPAPPANPVAIAVPHLDLRRAGPTTALGFRAVPREPAPDLVFLFGTGHTLYEKPAAITGKTLATPIGSLESEAEIVSRIVAGAGEGLRDEETAFRHEHSIEFPALHLAYRFGAPRVVAMIFGGFHRLVAQGAQPADDALYAATIEAVRAELARAREAGRRVLCVAAIDLSHVGARFGDVEPLDGAALERLRGLDLAALGAAERGGAEEWFQALAADGDATRVCGYSALHALLAVVGPAPGTLLRYEQSLEPGGSVVTCAALAWPGDPS